MASNWQMWTASNTWEASQVMGLWKEIDSRISKANHAQGQLHTRLFNQHPYLHKAKVYRAVVILSLLQGCESWLCSSNNWKNFKCAHPISSLAFLGQDHVSSLAILDTAESTSIESLVFRAQKCHQNGWFTSCSLLKPGKRPQNWPHKRYKDTVKEILYQCII